MHIMTYYSELFAQM